MTMKHDGKAQLDQSCRSSHFRSRKDGSQKQVVEPERKTGEEITKVVQTVLLSITLCPFLVVQSPTICW